MKEVWKNIPEYEGLYQASNFGPIRSLDRYVKGKSNSKQFKKGLQNYKRGLITKLAKKYKMSVNAIGLIYRNESWTHVKV